MRKRFLTYLLMAMLTLAFGVVDAKSLSQAVSQVKSQTGGKVLSAKTVIKGDKELHIIKVLTKDGRVKSHRIKGNTVRNKRPNETVNR